jgi:hypothetical protein
VGRLDTYTEDVPELHHAAAETVSGLFLGEDDAQSSRRPTCREGVVATVLATGDRQE